MFLVKDSVANDVLYGRGDDVVGAMPEEGGLRCRSYAGGGRTTLSELPMLLWEGGAG